MWAFRSGNECQRRQAEARAVRNLLAGHAGCTAVQIGSCEHPCLPEGRFLESYYLDLREKDVHVCAQLSALPLMSEKVDLLVMMHAMDRHGARSEWMSEAVRVLRPEGELIIVGRYLWPNAWLRFRTAPLGALRLRALIVRHGLYWEGARRVPALPGVYLARARRRMFGIRPPKPHRRRKQAARRSLEVPGAGRAG